jgi:PPM family protein phosphatase
VRVELFQNTMQGGRTTNQDRVAYAHSRKTLLLVVADGMGGHARGEVAAEIAVTLLTETLRRQKDEPIERPKQFLTESFHAVHQAIGEYARKHRMDEHPRTTCVACLVQEGHAYWAHAGDSRLYLFRHGRVMKRTKDHSRVQRLVDAGLIREDQALTHPERNRIYSCLGGEQDALVSVAEPIKLVAGDVVLLSSDGFWGTLTIAEIEAAVADEPISSALPKLMSRAAINGGARGDNLSVVAMAWEVASQPDLAYVDSAVTMPLSMADKGARSADTDTDDLSDAEIERTIAEIQAAIQKYTR